MFQFPAPDRRAHCAHGGEPKSICAVCLRLFCADCTADLVFYEAEGARIQAAIEPVLAAALALSELEA